MTAVPIFSPTLHPTLGDVPAQPAAALVDNDRGDDTRPGVPAVAFVAAPADPSPAGAPTLVPGVCGPDPLRQQGSLPLSTLPPGGSTPGTSHAWRPAHESVHAIIGQLVQEWWQA